MENINKERNIIKEEEEKKEEKIRKERKEKRKLKQEELEKLKKILMKKIDNATPSDLAILNEKIKKCEKIKKTIPHEKLDNFNNYYNDLLKQQEILNEIIQKKKSEELAKKLGYDPKKDINEIKEERLKLMDIEDEKIIKKNKLEEQKKRENTQIVSLENMNLSEIKIFKNQKISKKGEMFKDDLFKPIRENLCEINKKGDWILNEKINKNDILGWEKIKWVRAEIALNTKNFQVFYDGISSNDIQQGKLGDCYFLSSVSALTQFPKLITRLFYFKEKSEQNCYGCFLRINGIWQLILIDDFFPVYPSFNNKSYNIVFSSTNSNEIWVMLLEKAWAKVNGNYARIISGEPTEALDILTDAYSYKINLSNIKNDEEEKNIIK